MDVTYCTSNSDLFFGTPPDQLLGKSYKVVFPVEISHAINNLIGSSFLKKRRITLQEWSAQGRIFHLTLAQTSDYISIEIEWLNYEEKSLGFWIRELEIIRSTLETLTEPQKLIERATIGLRRVLGFERMVFFKANEEQTYDLISEAVGPFLSTASALPYSDNSKIEAIPYDGTRACFDFGKRQAKLLSHSRFAKPSKGSTSQDLSRIPTSLSYAYSLLDRQALTEEGIVSFIAVPLIIDGEVWGVFEGHHMSPHIAGRNMREALNLFSDFLSYQLSCVEMTSRLKRLERQIHARGEGL